MPQSLPASLRVSDRQGRPRKRRRLQFTVRSLLVLTILVAAPASYLAYRKQRSEAQDRVLRELRECGCGCAKYPFDRDWMYDLLGPDYSTEAAGVCIDFDYDANGLDYATLHPDLPPAFLLREEANSMRAFELLSQVDHLSDFFFADGHLTEDRAAAISRVRRLKRLTVIRSTISDGAFAHLARIGGLDRISLEDASFSIEELRHLRSASQLRHLDLQTTASNVKLPRDKAEKFIEVLSHLDQLDTLTISSLSEEDCAAIRKALPHVEVRMAWP